MLSPGDGARRKFFLLPRHGKGFPASRRMQDKAFPSHGHFPQRNKHGKASAPGCRVHQG